MLFNKPYVYMTQEKAEQKFQYHVSIFLKNRVVSRAKKTDNLISILRTPTGEAPSFDPKIEHPHRLQEGHPYENKDLVQGRVKIELELEENSIGFWHDTFEFTYNDINYPRNGCSDIAFVIAAHNDGEQNHKASTVGHMGDADD